MSDSKKRYRVGIDHEIVSIIPGVDAPKRLLQLTQGMDFNKIDWKNMLVEFFDDAYLKRKNKRTMGYHDREFDIAMLKNNLNKNIDKIYVDENYIESNQRLINPWGNQPKIKVSFKGDMLGIGTPEQIMDNYHLSMSDKDPKNLAHTILFAVVRDQYAGMNIADDDAEALSNL